MNTIEFTYSGQSIHLYMNSQAMFDIDDIVQKHGENADIVDIINDPTPQGRAALCLTAHILAKQGELCRRYLQYTAERIPPADELLALLSPMQMNSLRASVLLAIYNGYDQDKAEVGDIDEGLAELEKKTKQ